MIEIHIERADNLIHRRIIDYIKTGRMFNSDMLALNMFVIKAVIDSSGNSMISLHTKGSFKSYVETIELMDKMFFYLE